MLSLIARAIPIGLAAGFNPGPLQTYLINTTIAYGWRRGLLIVFSPFIADLPLMVAAVVLLAQFPPEFIRAIQLIGGLYVWYLAWGAYRNLRAGVQIGADETLALPPPRQILTKALLANWLNPNPYIFWSTVNGPLFVEGLQQSVWHGLAFLVAFYGTFMAILVGLVFVFDRMRGIDPRVTRIILSVTVLGLVIFGGTLVFAGLGLF
ncbi:MAG: LysE family transporter [Chloroflexi bacterium]|nr:LysE family transporter [Chloroflexota bacterium]